MSWKYSSALCELRLDLLRHLVVEQQSTGLNEDILQRGAGLQVARELQTFQNGAWIITVLHNAGLCRGEVARKVPLH